MLSALISDIAIKLSFFLHNKSCHCTTAILAEDKIMIMIELPLKQKSSYREKGYILGDYTLVVMEAVLHYFSNLANIHC